MTPPLGAITHFLGILDSVQNFQCATPKGLICETTVGGNYPLFGHFGFSSKFSMCYPKGAHSWHHRRGQLLTFWAFWIQFRIFNVLPQGAHWLGHLWLQFPTLGCKVSFAHFPGQRRRNKSIICGAINEKIELTVCLEHHELLHICKFDHFPLLPGQRPRTNHLRSKWHIQWEDWDRLLRKNTH